MKLLLDENLPPKLAERLAGSIQSRVTSSIAVLRVLQMKKSGTLHARTISPSSPGIPISLREARFAAAA